MPIGLLFVKRFNQLEQSIFNLEWKISETLQAKA